MPEIEIELEPIAEGQAELAREIGQLEAEGKRILDIPNPNWVADDLGIIPDAQTGNAGTVGLMAVWSEVERFGATNWAR